MLFGETLIRAGPCPPVVRAVQRPHGPPGPGAAAQAGGSQHALGGSRVLSVRRSAVVDAVTGFSLQRGEKLRQGSRCPDRKPQGEPLIRETTRKDAYGDSKNRFLPAPCLPYEAIIFDTLTKHSDK